MHSIIPPNKEHAISPLDESQGHPGAVLVML